MRDGWKLALRGAIGALALGALVWACGDAPTDDPRGYTKAPLEEPGLTVEPEPTTEMSELGEPIRPRPSPTPPSDTTSG